MLPSMLTAVLLYVTLISYTSATNEGASEPAEQPQHDEYNDIQQALLRGYIAKLHKNTAMRASRFQAAKRPADLFAAQRSKMAALRPKFYRNGETPEKRMYDYGLDYDSFVPPEKRSGNRH